MIKVPSTVAYRTTYAAVKQRDGCLYDVWTWNVYKQKWTRMSQHGSGFTTLLAAAQAADNMSLNTAEMLRANRSPPEPLK